MTIVRSVLMALALLVTPAALSAQAASEQAAPEQAASEQTPASATPAPAVSAPVLPAPAAVVDPVPAAGVSPATAAAKEVWPIRAPVPGIGMPIAAEMDFPEQFSPIGRYAKWMNNVILLPISFAISLFVLGLIFWIVVRYRRAANPVPSQTTHNTFIEIVWTLVPVLILVVIAVPSIGLIAKQYQPAPDNAVTIKVTGNQWYWSYTYPDHGGFEVISNMLKEKGDVAPGERYRTEADGPRLLAADNRLVVPAGVPLRIQTTAADVIHSFAIPAIWFKIDAVPGRLSERSVIILKPGVYFGQCSELCGARHAFMPIAVEAVTPAEFASWVALQGGTMPSAATKAVSDVVAPAAGTDGGAEDSNIKAEAPPAVAAPASGT